MATGSIILRNPTSDDAGQVGEAHAAAWEEGYTTLFAPEALSELASARRRAWTRILADPEFDLTDMLVAEEGGQVVGFSHFGRNSESEALGEIFGFTPILGSGVPACPLQ